jgi:hypothetical protein
MDLTEVHEQIDWLAAGTAGPLAPSRLTLKQVEVNAQVVRLPSEWRRNSAARRSISCASSRPSLPAQDSDFGFCSLPCSRYPSTTTRSGVR